MRPKAPQPSDPFTRDTKLWLERETAILAGKVIPSAQDRLAGHGCFDNSELLDLRQVIDIETARDMLPAEALAAMARARDLPTAAMCWQCYLECCGSGEVAEVFLFHAAIRGHSEAQSELLEKAMSRRRPHDPVGQLNLVALCFGLLLLSRSFTADENMEAEDIDDARLQGMGRLRYLGEQAEQHKAVLEALDDIDDDAERDGISVAVSGLEAALAGLKADAVFHEMATVEDRAEFADLIPAFDKPKPVPLPVEGHQVVPGVLLLRPDGRHRSEIVAAAKPIAGKRLPLMGGGKLAEARAIMLDQYPHLAAQTNKIFLLQAGKLVPKFNLILVGDAGGGKTSYAITMCEALGMPAQVIPAGGAADGSLGGTSSQYASGRMSSVLQFICETGVANPAFIVDEPDKAASGRQNGSLVDVLLNFIEPATASRYLDPGLETKVDLSRVSWILCANDLSTIPVPLRDRCRVIRIPSAGFEHIGPISERIIREVADERGQTHPYWKRPLEQDEIELVHRRWGGGSLRQLHFILEDFIVNREQSMGMH